MKLLSKPFWLGAALSSLAMAPLAEAAFTSYGAGNISDTINPAGYSCVVDYGYWIHNAGVVEPGVSSCDPIGTPTPRYPQLVGPASEKPTMTHRWWGSVSFLGEMTIGDSGDAAYITPDPITARVSNRGARLLSIPAGIKTLSNGIESTYQVPDPFNEVFDGIAVGNSAYDDMDAYLKDYSDGSATVQWRSGSTPVMEATFVYGSPYVYFTALQGQLVLRTKAADGAEKGTFYSDGNSLGVWTDVAEIRNHFLIVGDGDTQFDNSSSSEISVVGSDTITVAWLPDSSSATIQTFAQYAQQPVDEVFIDYSVDRSDNSVTISHSYRYQGSPVTTLAGLMPLQWKNSAQPLSGYNARSARGVVQFAATSQFSYRLPFVGVLPYFPEGIGDYDEDQLRELVQEFIDAGNWNLNTDTYWSGKNYGKVAELAAIARSHGMTTEADQLINWLKGELEDWFRANTSGGLDINKYFVYDENWNTLLGFDESFGAQQQLNDHHFHYGYFVRAAAEICRVDPDWCAPSAWGPMVELLIRDYAGGRDDPMFPYLRNFDPANGFSWASGHANFALGNNNESTSEAANAYGAIILYGLITGNDELVERGMYLHASSTAAYWEYWNNIDRYRGLGGDYDNFLPDYDKMTTSIIWGNGHVFSTWFSGAYAHILGIQGLPLSPLVLHIGQHPDYLADYVTLGMSGESSNGKPSGLPEGYWRDIWWNIWSMTDGDAAVADFNTVNFNYTPEAGETKAHTYHWIHTYKALGHLASGDGVLSADYPAALVFDNNGQKTYLAYNFGSSARTVTFSDGTSFEVPAGQMSVNGSSSQEPPAESPTEFDLTIQAEDYTAMSGVQTESTSDTGGGLNVGWIDTGDWLAYAGVEIPEAGTYRIEYRVASYSGGGRLSLDKDAGQTVLGALDIPATGGWQNWTTIQHEVELPAGTYQLGIYAAQGGWNINWFRIVKI
ncbi:glycosyl hydrolase [Microbulbifer thermotolerans]|uniref:glycosyl hydrolase n=1 Tax=Microbulbifer thermotolerans TaxID=252514 RepID=UPI00267340FD|nr:glycosyl hydrolase [Microbulbifer thermotolerans]WKT60097.1 glycosyl hydrolase [Microbulbifer thermotolerans]